MANLSTGVILKTKQIRRADSVINQHNFFSSITIKTNYTGHSNDWASTKVFSQENHLLSHKIFEAA